MDWYILMGEGLVAICIVQSIVRMIVNLASNNGFSMLADIAACIAEVLILILVGIYFKEEEMYELPAVAWVIFLATNVIRIFTVSWTYILFLVPLALMIVMIVSRWNMWGIGAGAALTLINMVTTVIIYYLSDSDMSFSVNFCLNLLNCNSLMGIACILFYLVVKEKRGPVTDSNRAPGASGGSGYGSGPMSW